MAADVRVYKGIGQGGDGADDELAGSRKAGLVAEGTTGHHQDVFGAVVAGLPRRAVPDKLESIPPAANVAVLEIRREFLDFQLSIAQIDPQYAVGVAPCHAGGGVFHLFQNVHLPSHLLLGRR